MGCRWDGGRTLIWSRLLSWGTGWMEVPFPELGNLTRVVWGEGRCREDGGELDLLNLKYHIGISGIYYEVEMQYHMHEVLRNIQLGA